MSNQQGFRSLSFFEGNIIVSNLYLQQCLFVDRASGKNTDRPKFQEMLNYVREGDQVVVHSMDRFARSLKDLVTEVDKLQHVVAKMLKMHLLRNIS